MQHLYVFYFLLTFFIGGTHSRGNFKVSQPKDLDMLSVVVKSRFYDET
jgi:hypothetical protein